MFNAQTFKSLKSYCKKIDQKNCFLLTSFSIMSISSMAIAFSMLMAPILVDDFSQCISWLPSLHETLLLSHRNKKP
ncbi:hypothetical protein XELAEV_18017418mg [Xenopus laevis]|uniref:Uncharacterized protein n=1 Tax=Xenopus laevis TaxID=8355 RepID=A0A974DDL2_XENLA|nr:hypothetical protein XELAEV_18017418mg [Xenopus laevis]